MYNEPAKDVRPHEVFLKTKPIDPPWTTVYTGECLTMDECFHLLKALCVVPSDPATRMIESICHGGDPDIRVTRLVMKTPAELGFKHMARVAVIDDIRKERGLALCPIDTALAIRAHYIDLPKDETVRVMSEPILVRGMRCVFAITRHSRDIMLDAVEYLENDLLMPHERLIYALSQTPIRAD